MISLSTKQMNILTALASTGCSMTREEMEPYAGKKGYSKALGAATRGIAPGSLEGLGYVRRLDDHAPFRYEVTADGLKALTGRTGESRKKSPAVVRSALCPL